MERESDLKQRNLLIFAVIAVLAALLRIIGLGSSSLTLTEAENAMEALQLFDKGCDGQLLYALPTALIFKVFGSSDFTTRFFPALMGILLSILPALLRNKIGDRKAAILAFLLAVDPVLLFWSKRADAFIPAVALFFLSVVLTVYRKKNAAFVCFLIALSGGSRILPACIIMAVCLAVSWIISSKSISGIKSIFPNIRGRLAGVFVLLLLCTAFGSFPGGIGSYGAGLVNSFGAEKSWAYPGFNAELIMVILYGGIPLILCVANSFRKNLLPQLLISAAGVAVLLLWRGAAAMPWIVILLWIGSLDTIDSLIRRISGERNFAFYLSACLVPAGYTFFYFRLVELFNQKNGNEAVQITWNGAIQTLPLTRFGGTLLLMAVCIVILCLIVKIMMGFVESDSVRRGILCGILVVFNWMLITQIWNSGGFDREGDHPLAAHVKNTANLLSGTDTSFADSAFFELLEETVLKHGDAKNTDYGLNYLPNDVMLTWYLRDLPGIQNAVNENQDLSGIDLIISGPEMNFESKGYVKTTQSLSWKTDWRQMSFQSLGKWLIFGDFQPVIEKTVSLWVRSDYIFVNE